MATRLHNVLQFAGLAVGVPVSLPHLINIEGQALVPDVCTPSVGGFTWTVNDTTVTVTRTIYATVDSVSLLVSHMHSVERVIDGAAALPVQPFIPAAGIAGGGGLPTIFVFRPGGITSGNIYATFPEIIAAMAPVDGPKVIQFDGSIVSPCVIPAGAYDMKDVTWSGSIEDSVPTVVSIVEGATFTNLRSFANNLNVTCNATVTSPISDFTVLYDAIVADNGVGLNSAAGCVPLISYATVPINGRVSISLEHSSRIGQTPTGVVVVGGLAAAGSRLTLYLGQYSGAFWNCFEGAVGTTLYTVFLSQNSFLYRPQSTWLGSYTNVVTGSDKMNMTPAMGTAPATTPQTIFAGTFLRLNATAGMITQVLPAIISASAGNAGDTYGRSVIIKETSGINGVLVDGYNAETIEGGLTYMIPPGGCTKFISDGVSNWTASSTANGENLATASLATLAALNTSGFDNGTLIYVIAEDNIWALQRASVDVPDGIDVIAAAGTGGGNWISQLEGRWDDLVMEPSVGNAAAALTEEAYLDTPLICSFFRHDQNDSLHFRFQLPHKWDFTKPIRPHIHVVPMGNPLVPEVVRFTGYYAWSRPGYAAGPLGNLGSGAWTAIPAQLFTVNPGDQYVQQLWTIVGDIVPPAWARESTLFLLYLVRTGTDPGDTYTTAKVTPPGTAAANLCILSSDIHYRAKKFGTITASPTP